MSLQNKKRHRSYDNNYNTRSKKQKTDDKFIQSEWVSASKLANYMLNDPVLDYYDMYCRNSPKFRSGNNKYNEFLQYRLNKGNEFEKQLIDKLEEKFSGCITMIYDNLQQQGVIYNNQFQKTIDAIKEGVPIIYQGVLKNDCNKTYGIADLIIRSDWINKLSKNRVLTNDESEISAPNINGKYHYVIVDIKWTTLHLSADGEHILNSERFPAYKAQLLVYNNALGLIQGYTPKYAFIIGRKYRYVKRKLEYRGFCFDRMGKIDYSETDFKYNERTKKAIQWIKQLRNDGINWTLIPPSREELYPNMNNLNDENWHTYKEECSEQLKELTMLWNCGYKNRLIGHKNGIFKWDDPRCKPELLGINGKKISPILKSIIDINRGDELISPKKIKNNMYRWKNKSKLDVFVDFEYMTDIFYEGLDPCIDGKSNNEYLFLIGVGWSVKEREWNYKSFVLENTTLHCEKTLVDNFVKFLEELFKKYNTNPNIYHWGHVERTKFNSINKKHGNIWSQSFKWVDLSSVFKNEPIVIKGMFGFGLKEVSKAMFSHGMIATNYSGIHDNGVSVMIHAWNYYNTNKTDKNIMDNIIKYNETDCKAMWEIINYLRKK